MRYHGWGRSTCGCCSLAGQLVAFCAIPCSLTLLSVSAEAGLGLATVRIQLSTKVGGKHCSGRKCREFGIGLSPARVIDSGTGSQTCLATAGLGSAVVLNLILVWSHRFRSLRGVNAAYGAAAIISVIVMGLVAALIFGLVDPDGDDRRSLRWIAGSAPTEIGLAK